MQKSNLLGARHPEYGHGGKRVEVLLRSRYRNSIDRFSGL